MEGCPHSQEVLKRRGSAAFLIVRVSLNFTSVLDGSGKTVLRFFSPAFTGFSGAVCGVCGFSAEVVQMQKVVQSLSPLAPARLQDVNFK